MCVKDLDNTVPAITKIVDDIKAGNWAGAIADGKALIADAEGDIVNCEHVVTGSDGKRLVAWIQ